MVAFIGTNSSETNVPGNTFNYIYGLDGNDTVGSSFAGPVTLDGGAGDDSLDAFGYSPNNIDAVSVLLGGEGADTLNPSNWNIGDRAYGGNGNDSFIGATTQTIATTLYFGEGGADTIAGGRSRDLADGGIGADSISGGDNLDTLFGGSDNDTIDGGLGNDMITGGTGADSLRGGADNDSIIADSGADLAYGDAGNDTIYSGLVDGIAGFGGDGNDQLATGNGADYLSGDVGDDTIFSGLGADSLFGGAGVDALGGYFGNDSLVGGAGIDYFNLTLDVRAGEFDILGDWSNADDYLFLPTAFSGFTTFGAYAGGAFALIGLGSSFYAVYAVGATVLGLQAHTLYA